MNETERHKEAFEYWFSLGATGSNANIKSTSTKFQVTERSIWTWYYAFNWRNRADIRLNANAKKLAAKSDTNIVNRKAKELQDLDDTDKIIQAMLREIVSTGEDGKARLKVKIEDARGFAYVVGASEKVKKLKQLLLGEVTNREGIENDTIITINIRPASEFDGTPILLDNDPIEDK